ncbi:PP2C family serine/threonine-protein phosphatase [Thermopolyspora sp. NPDC052614]|uniref:PP2C family serine/threonine-protein phosphatase n=1 Tax=Thermopolyspora sp. NPDC052614 TaxID=3155682 RepID=UPI003449AF75
MEQDGHISHAEESGTADTTPGIPEPLVIGRRPMLRSEPGTLPKVADRRPDTELDGADLPGLTVRSVSIRGDAHRYYGTVRQDAMGLWQVGDDRLLACVADGVGSKELSHVGAVTACKAAYENFADFLEGEDLKVAADHLFDNIGNDIRREAHARGLEPGELSTTLLAAVVEGNADTHRVTLLRVGDCSAFHLRQGVWMSCFPEDEDDPEQLATSITRALPRDVGPVDVAATILNPGEMLLLCTDGLSRPMRGEQVRAQLAEWWSAPAPPSLPEFLWQLSFRVKTHDDDRTAICLWRT